MSSHHKHALEEEANCQFAEAGGIDAGCVDGYAATLRWLGVSPSVLPPAKDGKAKDRTLNRLGQIVGRGRGACAVDGVDFQGIPYALKGNASGKGYGNKDVTMKHGAIRGTLDNGMPFWVILLRGNPDQMEMRRIDLCQVLMAVDAGTLDADVVKIRDSRQPSTTLKRSVTADESVFNSQTGKWDNVTVYPRMRVLWSKVAELRPDLFWDADFVPFKAEIPLPWSLR